MTASYPVRRVRIGLKESYRDRPTSPADGPHDRPSGTPPVRRSLVATRFFRRGAAREGTADLRRGGALGAILLQFTALAFSLCAARPAGIRHLSGAAGA